MNLQEFSVRSPVDLSFKSRETIKKIAFWNLNTNRTSKSLQAHMFILRDSIIWEGKPV